jgi:N utilization substance protein B
MAKVDLALIRLAVYEIKYEADIPTGVAINEAVELAKVYSSDGAPAFVNGVLAKLV